ncbi:N-alpha-acetyltransferase Nat5p [[Candida] jaroonii]|uniref:N-alpha-acetyltransferase Nat5p n=1 Tax=[Candida] jaroonii TaxID=467808 RepID=A0ACA9Y884_9ASCO|nr:N-alpha-acetyltransferase Nat5p [[Candida] jaroonii]
MPSINLDDLTTNNLGVFKKIFGVTLPIEYSEDWYANSFDSDQIVKLAFYSELPVGAMKAKLLNIESFQGNFDNFNTSKLVSKSIPNAVYLETLSVLESYRNLGIGEKLLNYLIEETTKRFVHEIIIHVHVENTKAIDWYKKHGFVEKELLKDYYKSKGLTNPDAYILSLKV